MTSSSVPTPSAIAAASASNAAIAAGPSTYTRVRGPSLSASTPVTTSEMARRATEVCDDEDTDEDCNEVADNDDDAATGAMTWYLDEDGDGIGVSSTTALACDAPSGYGAGGSDATSLDCDDTDDSVWRETGEGDCIACTLYVPDDHSTIQDAIDSTSDGDSVCVEAGTYAETLDFGGKAISVIGLDGADSTIIDAEGAGTVVTFNDGEGAESVLEGFT